MRTATATLFQHQLPHFRDGVGGVGEELEFCEEGVEVHAANLECADTCPPKLGARRRMSALWVWGDPVRPGLGRMCPDPRRCRATAFYLSCQSCSSRSLLLSSVQDSTAFRGEAVFLRWAPR